MTEVSPGDVVAFDGATISDAELDVMFERAERGEFPGTAGRVTPGRPGRPTSVGDDARPFTFRLDAARRLKLERIARERHIRPSQVVRDLIDAV